MKNKLLLDEYPLIVLPELAARIGLNEAIILQQIHYWLSSSKTEWIYNSYEQWKKNFPFWCTKTIQRAITHLETLGLLISEQRQSTDRRKYYQINYDELDKLSSHQDKKSSWNSTKSPDAAPQNVPMLITETTTEITEETEISEDDKTFNEFQKVWEQETGQLITGSSAFYNMVMNFILNKVTPDDFLTAIREQKNSQYSVKHPTSVEAWALGIAELRNNPGKKKKSKNELPDMQLSENRNLYKGWLS